MSMKTAPAGIEEKPMPRTMFEGGEGGLLNLGELVLRVAVQLHHAYVDQRVIAVGPDLGEAERVVLGYLT